MRVELDTAEIPDTFTRFLDLVGDSHWRKRVAQIKSAIKGNPLLREHLIGENEIAFGFNACSDLTQRYGRIPINEMDCRHVYPCMALAAQILSIIDISTSLQARQLVRRVHGALKNPDDMRALQLELAVATHFTRRGHSLAWPETDGTGTMDMVINDLGPSGLEVECKSVSSDKGRKIHRTEALEFWHLLSPKLKTICDRLKIGLSVVLTVEGRLSPTFKNRQQLAQMVLSNLLNGQSITMLPSATLRVSEFDPSLLGVSRTEGTPVLARATIDQITQTENREVMIIGRKSGGAIAFVLQSSDDDTPLPYVFDTLARSASRQLSKNRAGLFLVGFHGIEAESLLSIAEQDSDANQPPTALTRHVSDFLSGQSRDHVIGVGFLSKSGLHPHDAAVLDSGGSTYIFPKKESPFWHEDFTGLFSPP